MKKDVAVGVIILIIVGLIVWGKFHPTGKSVGQHIEIVSLDAEQQQKVVQTILSSEFIEDMPRKGVIALRFYDFNGGSRRWRDGFLIGKNQLLSSGEPDMYLYLHSKYIAGLNNENFCEVVKGAKANGDLGFYSKKSKAKLFLKYALMLKHRGCFGI